MTNDKVMTLFEQQETINKLLQIPLPVCSNEEDNMYRKFLEQVELNEEDEEDFEVNLALGFALVREGLGYLDYANDCMVLSDDSVEQDDDAAKKANIDFFEKIFIRRLLGALEREEIFSVDEYLDRWKNNDGEPEVAICEQATLAVKDVFSSKKHKAIQSANPLGCASQVIADFLKNHGYGIIGYKHINVIEQILNNKCTNKK